MKGMLSISADVLKARALGLPIVALETTVITHGLPHPENIQLAFNIEEEVLSYGATPAAIGVVDGQICVGLNRSQLEVLARHQDVHKVSVRDFAPAIVKRWSGGTTVAGTLFAAHKAGIQIFATGGIGGVHRNTPEDVSTDLTMLSRTPVIVVCAGAKAILDLPATLEMLETLGVPVVGFQTDEFPAFFTRSSGLKTSVTAESAEEAAKIALKHWELGFESAVLVVVPPPEDVALSEEEVNGAINQAVAEVEHRGIRGQEVTPYLLDRVSEITGQRSLQANLGLLLNNARVAAQIAGYLKGRRQGVI